MSIEHINLETASSTQIVDFTWPTLAGISHPEKNVTDAFIDSVATSIAQKWKQLPENQWVQLIHIEKVGDVTTVFSREELFFSFANALADRLTFLGIKTTRYDAFTQVVVDANPTRYAQTQLYVQVNSCLNTKNQKFVDFQVSVKVPKKV